MSRNVVSKVMWVRKGATLPFFMAAAMSALLSGLVLVAANSAQAATFTVNSTADAADTDTTDGACDVDLTTEGNQCTLRAAIGQANASAGADAIGFNIPESDPGRDLTTGVFTISPASELPAITSPLTIDGYTQPGASPNTLAVGNNAKLLIELSGANAGVGANGLEIFNASDSVVRGLVINRWVRDGIRIHGFFNKAAGNKIQGNYIGTDATGTMDLGNRLSGVEIMAQVGGSAANTTVGGPLPATRNVISGNGIAGVRVHKFSSEVKTSVRDTKIVGNYIGTDATGTAALGNEGAGVAIHELQPDPPTSMNITVGGMAARTANTIAFNGEHGIVITGFHCTGNRLLGNSIFSNGDLGINLGRDGRTPNDPKDRDNGANTLQNFPVITSATSSSSTTIKAKLNSNPNRKFLVQFFFNPPGGDEGKDFIGQRTVTTNAEGNATFAFKPARRAPVRGTVTATATGPRGDTSEFSKARAVVRP